MVNCWRAGVYLFVLLLVVQPDLISHNGDVVRVAIQGLGEIENIIVVPGAGND